MHISKSFVIAFLACFLAVIIGNIAALSFGFYAGWMLYLLVGFLLVFGFLFFRKK